MEDLTKCSVYIGIHKGLCQTQRWQFFSFSFCLNENTHEIWSVAEYNEGDQGCNARYPSENYPKRKFGLNLFAHNVSRIHPILLRAGQW